MRNFPFVVSFSIIAMFFLASSVSAADQEKTVPTVVHVHLTGVVTDSPREEPPLFTGGVEFVCLKEVLERFEAMRDDPRVAGVIITISDFNAGLGQLEEIRGAVVGLEEAGKLVRVHAGTLDTFLYAAMCGGGRINMPPEGNLFLTGLYAETLYLKGLLDKIGIEADVVRVGRYKSAGETFTRAGPSKAAAADMSALMDGLYGNLIESIVAARAMSADEVRGLVDGGPYSSKTALAAKLIDSRLFLDELVAAVEKELGGEIVIDNDYARSDAPSFDLKNPMALFKMFSEMGSKKAPTTKVVGLLFAEGVITPGYGAADVFAGDAAYGGMLRHALTAAAADESIEALVLRVNSPGGVVTACEEVLHAEETFKKSGKPLVVSLGNVAASGGYYIACAGDAVFADASTITGSIGVIGGKPVASGLMAMIGASPHSYKRGANADMVSLFHPFTPEQEARIRGLMASTYETFKGHVIRLRGDKLRKPIEELAGGRVFTGRQAVDLGLIDEVGGLTAAIAHAAKLAKMIDYEVRIIPEPKSFLERLKEAITGAETNHSDISARVVAPVAPRLGIRAPSELDRIDSRLGGTVRSAFRKLALLRDHRVVALTPFDLIIH